MFALLHGQITEGTITGDNSASSMSATDIATAVTSSIATAASSGALASTIATIAASPDQFFSYDFSNLVSYSYDGSASALATVTVGAVSTAVTVTHTPTPTLAPTPTESGSLVLQVSAATSGRKSGGVLAPVLVGLATVLAVLPR